MEDDIASDSFISKWPNWLRWFLVLPTSLIGSVLVSILYTLFLMISGFFSGFSAGGFLNQLISSAIIGGIFVYGGAWVAPQKQFFVSIFLLILLTIISTILFLFSFGPYSSIGPIEYGIHTVAILVAGGYAVYLIKEETDENIQQPI